MMDAMDTQSPTYSDDELTASLAEHLASLDRDDSYRVERVLKCSDVETTELVYFEGSGGGSLGPFVPSASMLRRRLAGPTSACLRLSGPDAVLNTYPGLSIAAARARSSMW